MTFPIQLIPNNHGLFQSIGLDTAAGFAVLGVAAWSRVRSGMPLFPPLGGGGVEGTGSGNGKGDGGRGGRGFWESVKVPWKLEAARVKKKVCVGGGGFLSVASGGSARVWVVDLSTSWKQDTGRRKEKMLCVFRIYFHA